MLRAAVEVIDVQNNPVHTGQVAVVTCIGFTWAKFAAEIIKILADDGDNAQGFL